MLVLDGERHEKAQRTGTEKRHGGKRSGEKHAEKWHWEIRHGE